MEYFQCLWYPRSLLLCRHVQDYGETCGSEEENMVCVGQLSVAVTKCLI